jgi:hypothetical protein
MVTLEESSQNLAGKAYDESTKAVSTQLDFTLYLPDLHRLFVFDGYT